MYLCLVWALFFTGSWWLFQYCLKKCNFLVYVTFSSWGRWLMFTWCCPLNLRAPWGISGHVVHGSAEDVGEKVASCLWKKYLPINVSSVLPSPKYQCQYETYHCVFCGTAILLVWWEKYSFSGCVWLQKRCSRMEVVARVQFLQLTTSGLLAKLPFM